MAESNQKRPTSATSGGAQRIKVGVMPLFSTERTVLVTTQLDNAAGLLKPEMTGNAKVYCGKQRAIDLVMRRIVRYLRVEFWSCPGGKGCRRKERAA